MVLVALVAPAAVLRSGSRRSSGLVGEMTDDGWVRVNGELWRARGGAAGERVRVRAASTG